MIRSTFQAFETAKRALSASQAGLDTVGHNISNVNTLGYTRQRVDQVSLSTNGMSIKYQVHGSGGTKAGNGVNVNSISQIRDPYLDNRYRNEATANGQLAVRQDGLTDINNIFDETTADGLSAKLNELINYLDKFSESPDDENYASVVRSCANELASMISKNASQLETARAQQTMDFSTSVGTDLNDILKQISSLNGQIKEENIYGNPANELNDERNLLLDRLSEYLDIQVVRTPVKVSDDITIERLSIELRNSGNPPITLVDSMGYKQFNVTTDEDTGNVSFNLCGDTGQKIEDITNKIYKGAVKGYIDIINGVGPNAGVGENSFRGIPYYQQSLDEFAQTVAEVFNRINNVTNQQYIDSNYSIAETFGFKNLFVPQVLDKITSTTTGSKPDWIDTITAGTLQFSGKDYEIKFSDNSAYSDPFFNNKVIAEIDGKIYAADITSPYTPSSKLDFYEVGYDSTATPPYSNISKLAFSVNTTDKAIPDWNVSTKLDAKINSKNITISSSWLDDPLYITTSKQEPVTNAKPVLSIASGGAKPSWLNSISFGGDGMQVPNGDYVFDITFTGTPSVPDTISVKIKDPTTGVSTTYTAKYKADTELQLKCEDTASPNYGKVGLTIVTNYREPTAKSSENTVSLRNSTGAKSDNLQKLSAEIKAPNAYLVSGFKGSLPEFLVNLQRDMSMDKQSNTQLLEASTTIITEYADRRDSVSAVSIDEEGINMMTYQNYYNAAARYMNVIDEALDKIINGMGTVGR